MFQVRKSRFCGISVTYFQCCLMSETQVLTSVSNLFIYLFIYLFIWRGGSSNHFLEGGGFIWKEDLFFNGWGFIFKWGGGGCPMEEHQLWWGDFQKKSWDGGVPLMPPHYGKPCFLSNIYILCYSQATKIKDLYSNKKITMYNRSQIQSTGWRLWNTNKKTM